MNFWSHVSSLGSLVIFEKNISFLSLEARSEPEVRNFEYFFVLFGDENKNVLEFEVAVGDAL